jgi:hypothetical protein
MGRCGAEIKEIKGLVETVWRSKALGVDQIIVIK